MTSDHGNDRRRQVDAKHEADDELEADPIADTTGKAFHRLLSVPSDEGFSSHVREVGGCRARPLDNFGQKIDIRMRQATDASLYGDAAGGFLIRLGAVPVHLL